MMTIETFCNDCGTVTKTKTWQCHDYDESQGDEIYNICRDCWHKSRHQSRILNDSRNENDDHPEEA